MEVRDDALHYLKMYRSDQEQWGFFQKNYEDELKQKIKDFGDAKERFVKRLKELDVGILNDPLTWDELRTMERKPVWMEYNLHLSDKDARSRSRMWIIVQKIMPWRQDDELIYYSGFVFSKEEIGKTWQAYRKEKK